MKYLIPLLFVLLSCSSSNDQNEISQKEEIHPELVEKQNNQQPIYEVAKVDYHGNFLQRIFVVISKDQVYNSDAIKKIICLLENEYSLDTKSNISFFSEKKYANYKDSVFTSFKEPSGISAEEKIEYEKWKNDYYLGEFEVISQVTARFTTE